MPTQGIPGQARLLRRQSVPAVSSKDQCLQIPTKPMNQIVPLLHHRTPNYTCLNTVNNTSQCFVGWRSFEPLVYDSPGSIITHSDSVVFGSTSFGSAPLAMVIILG